MFLDRMNSAILLVFLNCLVFSGLSFLVLLHRMTAFDTILLVFFDCLVFSCSCCFFRFLLSLFLVLAHRLISFNTILLVF